ncbi:DEAD/DEAH box helicase [Naumannella halotolerans]|uniref:DEAD/DEAH box helicase n=1 Tax=Naumannella halotolerans TaxID=993414 RepID=UPI00370D9BAB
MAVSAPDDTLETLGTTEPVEAPVADAAVAVEPTGETVTVTTDEAKAISFADLGVHPDIVAALEQVGISSPFPIQQMSIPIATAGTDMIGQARTGTGKTLAFGISLLQRIGLGADAPTDKAAGKPQALVICPTRELASQVAKDLQTASTIRKARILTVYGGVGYEPQLDALKSGVDVVVGTPGRLLDLANQRALDLSHVKVAVLDEADEMLDLGFLPDVEKLLAKTPTLRQTLLFSATMPSQIVTLARRHLRQPMNIRAESASENQTVPATSQFVYQAHDLDKPEVVARILQAKDRDRAIIFCRTKRAAQRLTDDLDERGFSVAPIHGDLTQVAREKALKKFREGSVDVMVATDVAARGIDVTGVTHVINYECPDDDKTYVHRIGRTGRAGKSGVAVTFVDWPDVARWKMINKTLGLPYDTPVETYSTSAHLFSDLKIPEGTKGRLKPAKPVERKPREEGRERPRSERPRRDRNRRRTHNGEPVAEDSAKSTDTAPKTDQRHSDGDAAKTGEAPSRRRRRRRRGGRGGRGGDGGEQSAPTQANSNA